MASWQTALTGRLGRKPLGAALPVADLRRQYEDIFAGYGSAPADIVIEPAQLGQVRGEWLRVKDVQSSRLIIYLHGGGYVAGSPQSHRALIARLCRSAGAAALALNYRLGPEFPFPAGLRDAVDAYRFLTGKGFAPSQLVLAGDGAGGGLAFAAMMALRNSALPMPACCVAMSPWADLSLSGWSMLQNARGDGVLSWELLFLSARHYLQGANPADIYASPVFGSFRDFPPVMIHAGSLEVLRDDASRLGELAAASNIPVSVEIYDRMNHVFQASSVADAQVSVGRLGQFIRARIPDAAADAPPAKNEKARSGARET
jgi:acetyl esterase/lipase